MNNGDQSTFSADDIWKPLAKLWSDCTSEANEHGKRLMEAVGDNADPRIWRQRWTAAMTDSIDVIVSRAVDNLGK